MNFSSSSHGGTPQDMLSDFSATGKVLTAQEKLSKAIMKGYCVRCGTKTHTGHPIRRKQISSELVWQGVCIKCNPDKVPKQALMVHQEMQNGGSSSSRHGINNNNNNNTLITETQRLAAKAFMEARRKVHLPTSARQKVMESWHLVKDDLRPLGMDFFISVFQKHPHLKALFQFFSHHQQDDDNSASTSVEDMRNSKLLQTHAYVVMKMLGRAMAGLSDMETMIPELRALGRMHTLVGILPEYYDLIFQSLMDALARKVGSQKWTKETQEAWELCYGMMVSIMKDPSRRLDVEPPEGWGLYHSLACGYLAVATPFRLATTTTNGVVVPIDEDDADFSAVRLFLFHDFLWSLVDLVAIAVVLLDGFGEHFQSAIQLKSRRSKGIKDHGAASRKQKWWAKFKKWWIPMKFRLNRLLRRLQLGRWTHWTRLDWTILMSVALEIILKCLFTKKSSGMLVVVAMMQCAGMARVVHFWHCAELMALKNGSMRREQYQNVQIARLFVVMMYMVHFLGCMYCMIAQIDTGSHESAFAARLLPILQRHHGSSGGKWNAYLHAIYWAFVNMTGIGHYRDNDAPETSLEIIFSLVVHLMGVSFYVVAAGNLFGIVQNRTQSFYQVEEGLASLTEFMDDCNVPRASQDRFLSSYLMGNLLIKPEKDNSTTTSTTAFSPDHHANDARPLMPDSAQKLPLHLNMELTLFSRAKALRKRGIKHASDDFSFGLVEMLIHNITLLPGDYLVRAGNKVGPRVLMVDKGVLEIFVDGVSKGCLYPGDIIGTGWLATIPLESKDILRHKSYLDWRSAEGIAIADIRAMEQCRLVMGLQDKSEVAHLQRVYPTEMQQLAKECEPTTPSNNDSAVSLSVQR
jgi:hemoglobin-like flavoprotein